MAVRMVVDEQGMALLLLGETDAQMNAVSGERARVGTRIQELKAQLVALEAEHERLLVLRQRSWSELRDAGLSEEAIVNLLNLAGLRVSHG